MDTPVADVLDIVARLAKLEQHFTAVAVHQLIERHIRKGGDPEKVPVPAGLFNHLARLESEAAARIRQIGA